MLALPGGPCQGDGFLPKRLDCTASLEGVLSSLRPATLGAGKSEERRTESEDTDSSNVSPSRGHDGYPTSSHAAPILDVPESLQGRAILPRRYRNARRQDLRGQRLAPSAFR